MTPGPASPRARRLDLACAGLLALAPALLLHPALFLGRGLVPADGIFRFQPWSTPGAAPPSNRLLSDQFAVFAPQREFFHARLWHGDFPLWNPHIDCGVPNLASMQGALLFPLNLLLAPLDPFRAAGLAAFAKLFGAAFSTWWLARRIGISRAGALLAGLVFSLCGFFVVWLGHPQTNVAMTLPLLLLLADAGVRGPGLRPWIGLAAIVACAILGGHPPTLVHVLLLLGAFIAMRLARAGGQTAVRGALLFAAALLAGALLAAPQLLPFLEYWRESSAALSSATLARGGFHLGPAAGAFFFLPFLDGSPTAGFEGLGAAFGIRTLTNFGEHTGYVGILPLVLAALAVARRRDAETRFFATAVAVSLLIAFGAPPLPALLQRLPVLNGMNHVRLLMVVGLGVALLAGRGLDTLAWRPVGRQGRGAAWLLALGAASAAGFAALLVAAEPAGGTLAPAAQAFLARQLGVLAIGLGVSAWATVGGAPLRPQALAALCVAVTTVDLLRFAWGYNPAVPRDRYYPTTPGIERLVREPGPFRVLGAGTVLLPDTAAVYGLDDARGVDFMSVRRYEELVTGRAGDFSFYGSAPEIPPVLPLLNVRYLLTAVPIDLPRERFELVHTGDMAIYRDLAAVERALVVLDHEVVGGDALLARVRSGEFDPRRTVLLEREPGPAPAAGPSPANDSSAARILRDDPDEVVVEATAPRPGFLLLLDTDFPGWEASVDGRPERIWRADWAFRAVQVPAGRSTVRFVYRPRSWRAGLALGGLSLTLLGVGWAIDAGRRRPPGGGSPSRIGTAAAPPAS